MQLSRSLGHRPGIGAHCLVFSSRRKSTSSDSSEVSGDQTAVVLFDVRQSPEAVVLQFKEIVGMIERLLDEPETH